ncbi:MAG: exodeoxyribonuclease VII small subunit [Verrucomicrobiia bacterium]
MSKSPKNASGTAQDLAQLPFEEALQRLEAIVAEMESETLPLEQLLTRYEEGVKLVEVCQTRLAAAELRIQQLEKTASGEARLKPLEVEPEAPGK